MHPDTELRFVNDQIGYGVFAKQPLPQGTMVYVKDRLEIEVTPHQYADLDVASRQVVDKYSYRDERGVRVVSWDFAKYVNHCCQFNTISTGYGFEIAVRDIAAGEQITDEYGIFNMDGEITLCCQQGPCRGRVSAEDFDLYYPVWDEKIRIALAHFDAVPQPLLPFLRKKTLRELGLYLHKGGAYRSVYALRHRPVSVALPVTNGKA